MMQYRPNQTVWEMTNACNAKCIHCGSKSGKARENELSEEEALRVCDELKTIGCQYVTLIGGEVFLCDYWDKVCERLIQNGIRVSPLTNGILLNDTILQRLQEIGVKTVHFSLDGLEKTHDYIRGVPGLFKRVVEKIKLAKEYGFQVGINTTVSPLNLEELPTLHQLFDEVGVKGWQLQVVENIGNAQDKPDIMLSIEQLYQLAKYVADFRTQQKLRVFVGDNIGYYCEFEPLIRDHPFTGCAAGRSVLGIEANGNIRACLSIPSLPEFNEANIRERSLVEIWNDPNLFGHFRRRTVDQLTGFCAQCEYRNLCRAGCSSLSFSLTGNFYENPFCLHKYEIEQGFKTPGEKTVGIDA